MSDDRIPCPWCGSMILEITARCNDGLCARCKSVALKKRFLQDAQTNPPPLHLDYKRFSRKEFIEALAKTCLLHATSPETACREFLGFCEPILQRTSIFTVFFPWRMLPNNLKKLPSPFRELMAVYQAWGMMSMNGFDEYAGSTISKFDDEVDRGLEILGQTKAKGILSQARRIRRQNNGELPQQEEDRVWSVFMDSMPNFESEILGPKLIVELNTNAEQ